MEKRSRQAFFSTKTRRPDFPFEKLDYQPSSHKEEQGGLKWTLVRIFLKKFLKFRRKAYCRSYSNKKKRSSNAPSTPRPHASAAETNWLQLPKAD
jgi:hypothetical protein